MMKVVKNGKRPTGSTRDGPQSLPAALSRVNLNAAGIDVVASSHFVAVPGDRSEPPVREFHAYTADLYRLAECGVKTVAMESTSLYRIKNFPAEVQVDTIVYTTSIPTPQFVTSI